MRQPLQVTSGETTEGAPRSAPLPEAVVSRKHMCDPSRLLHPLGARTFARLLGGIWGFLGEFEEGNARLFGKMGGEAQQLGEDEEGLGKAHLPHVLNVPTRSQLTSL
jgi:hypothetical protein